MAADRKAGPSSDRATVTAATIAATIMIAQQIGGKATRDALFLSSFPATELPKVMIAAAGLSVVGVLIMSRALARFGPARLVPLAFITSGGLFALEWSIAADMPEVVAWLVYLHMAAFGSIVISGFWSVINERFDPHAAKRHVARIGVGATFGGVLGGVGAERVAALLDVNSMLLALAGLNVLCGLCIFGIGGAGTRRVRGGADGPFEGLRILRRTRYLQHLAGLVAVVAVTAVLLDYAFKAQAAAHIHEGESLMQFFAVFYTVAGVLTFFVQTTVARKSLEKIGLDWTIAILPVTVIMWSVLGAAYLRLWSVTLLRGAEHVLANSLFRSAYELLYTPVVPEKKRPTKTIIDVAFERIGDATGGGIVLLVLWATTSMGTEIAERIVIGLAGLGAIAAFWISRRLNRGYVAGLAESLRTGAVQLDADDVVDATTRRTLTETTMALDREKLLSEIRALRMSQAEVERPSPEPLRASVPSQRPPPRTDPELRELVDAFLSDDPDQIGQALTKRVPPGVVGHVIPLLARRDLHRSVISALRKVADRSTGQLLDALLDEEQPFVVRRRVPRVLSAMDSRRAAEGLFAGLADPRFEVRYQCGQALASIMGRNEDISFETERVFEATLRELAVGSRVWESRRLLDEEPDDRSPWLDDVIHTRLHRSLEHVFTILSFTLEREPLELSLHALNSEDTALRGTALEYLENVLPENIRKKLWPYLGQERPDGRVSTTNRPKKQIVEDLLRSMDSLSLDRAALARALEKRDSGESADGE